VFYASRNGDYRRSPSAIQFHLAESDDYVATSGAKKPERQLSAAGKDAEFYIYPGTAHWFFESDRADAYNAQAAKLAWSRTVEFLKKHVG
jgi:carboxymethylenebutenolidase